MRWTSALALPVGVSAIALGNDPLPEPLSLKMNANYGVDDSYSANVGTESSWPAKWFDATAHGKFIAHRMSAQELADYVHAKSGTYEGETSALGPIPSLKMTSAIPGFKPQNVEQVSKVTHFPSYLALASTFDPYCVGEVATAVAQEFKTLGANTMLGPTINVHRAWVNDESFDSLSGEDPTLGSVLTRHWMLAAHEEGVLSVPKFFGAVEGPVDKVSKWDQFYPPFQAAVDNGAAGIMCADKEVDGTWACQNMLALDADLKGTMKFHGFIMSPKNGSHDSAEMEHVMMGTDLAIGTPQPLTEEEELLPALQEAAMRVIAAIWHLRLEENPECELPCATEFASSARSEAHTLTAMRAAGSAVTLLKNDGNILPITAAKYPGKTIAVLGPAANEAGDYLEGPDDDEKIDLLGFAGADGPYKVDMTGFTPAYGIYKVGTDKGFTITGSAAGADICLVFVGSKLKSDKWNLNDESIAAIDSAIASCSKVAVLMETMGAVFTPFRDQVGAIANLFHAGEETAFAWAITLFGEQTPSGKLPISFPAAESYNIALPSYWNSDFKSAFPFGHGLSYANFTYSDFEEKPDCLFDLCVMVTVTNNSPVYKGAEVVQVYFRYLDTDHPTVLKGFYKTDVLKPGKQEKVFFHFNYRDLCLFDKSQPVANPLPESYWVPQDNLDILVGSSSTDIRSTLTVKTRHE